MFSTYTVYITLSPVLALKRHFMIYDITLFLNIPSFYFFHHKQKEDCSIFDRRILLCSCQIFHSLFSFQNGSSFFSSPSTSLISCISSRINFMPYCTSITSSYRSAISSSCSFFRYSYILINSSASIFFTFPPSLHGYL